MSDRLASIQGMQPCQAFFIGFDSDGCVFDGMEIKHKECFCPAYIKHFGLQAVSTAARQAWEFVNLYSTTRGTNRFKALVLTLDVLRRHPQVAARRVEIPTLPTLRAWLAQETQLGTPALAAAVERTGDEELRRVLAWNAEVNQQIKAMCHGILPFPYAKESITDASLHADLMVVSQASADALAREWAEAGLIERMCCVAGQEVGTKAEQLRAACAGKYAPEKVLLCGDAPGDREAALANGARFFPIIPGQEEASWRRFREEALDRFLAGRFDDGYQQCLLAEFAAVLPEAPSWEMAPVAVR